MDFINDTKNVAFLFRSEFEPDRLYNSLLSRIRYTIDSENGLSPRRSGETA